MSHSDSYSDAAPMKILHTDRDTLRERAREREGDSYTLRDAWMPTNILLNKNTIEKLPWWSRSSNNNNMFKLGAQLATGCIQQFLEKRSHVACGRRGDSAHFQRGRSVSVAVVVAAILAAVAVVIGACYNNLCCLHIKLSTGRAKSIASISAPRAPCATFVLTCADCSVKITSKCRRQHTATTCTHVARRHTHTHTHTKHPRLKKKKPSLRKKWKKNNLPKKNFNLQAKILWGSARLLQRESIRNEKLRNNQKKKPKKIYMHIYYISRSAKSSNHYEFLKK